MSFCTECLIIDDLTECLELLTVFTNGSAGVGYLVVKNLATNRTTQYEGIIDSGGVAEFEDVLLMLGGTYKFTILDEFFNELLIIDGDDTYPCFQAQTYNITNGNTEVVVGSFVSNP